MSTKVWDRIPRERKDEIAEKYAQKIDLSDIALEVGIKLPTLQRHARNYNYHKKMFLGMAAARVLIPRSVSRSWMDFVQIEGDDAIVIGDIEIPDHRAEILELALLTGMQRNIKRLIINGDLIATDQQALNEWVSRWKVSGTLTFEESKDLVIEVLQRLADWFDEIYIVEGNHDDRIARKTGGEVHFGMFIPRDMTQVKYSRYSYMYMRTTSRGLIKFVHPDNYSNTPVKLGQDFYDVEVGPNFDPANPFKTVEKCHFVISHTHIDQAGWTKDSVYEVHAIGTCRDKRHTAYVNKGQAKFHQWSPSFLVIQDGHFEHMHLWGTNWEKELGDIYTHSPLAKVI